MQEITGYIHDGYTRETHIRAREGLWPAVRLTYRPMLMRDRSIIYRKISTLNDPALEETLAANAVASYVQEWDLKRVNPKDGSLEPVPVTTDSALQLQPELVARLFSIVCGTDAGDREDGNSEGQGSDSSLDDDLRDALNPDVQAPVAPAATEESDAKN